MKLYEKDNQFLTRDTNKPKTWLFRVQYNVFKYTARFFWVLLILSFIGITFLPKPWVDRVHHWVILYVSIYLIVRFNPFVTFEYNKLDQKVAYTSGLFLFMTTIYIQYFGFLQPYIDEFSGTLKKVLSNWKLQ